MTSKTLRARLSKVEALFAGATTPGERAAAREALRRLKVRLAQEQRSDDSHYTHNGKAATFTHAKWRRSKRTRDARGRWTTTQSSYSEEQQTPQAHDTEWQERPGRTSMTFRLSDCWSKYLLFAVARQHGLTPYRHRRWPALTFALEGPESVLDDVVLELETFGRMLAEQLAHTTKKVVLEKVDSRITDALWCRWGNR